MFAQSSNTNPTALVTGSVRDTMNKTGKSLAETFLSVDAIIMVDSSGSMSMTDAGGGRSRYEAACKQLERLQNDLPGKIAVACFSCSAALCASGLPEEPSGGTDMEKALKLLKRADGCGIKLILISDGEPDDETAALTLARTFESKIDCIFVGSENGSGRDFLRRLAEVTGGISITNEIEKLNLLSDNVKLLLAA